MADTTYIVLARTGNIGEWVEQENSQVSAANPRAAIKAFLAFDARANSSGTYVAVPARSWKPVQVEAVQTTVLKLT